MLIEKLNIQSFGMLISREYLLSEGINLFEGENETGKSTISAFIKFMLYGLEKRSVQGKLSERQRYINWKNGEASGSMILSSGGKRYKIERFVRLTSVSESGRENYRESLSVIDTENGMRVFDGEIPGEVFLGVSGEVFENTAYIKQLGVSGVDATLVGEAIQNILFSADERINTGRAEEKLDLLRRGILHKNEKGGALYEAIQEKSITERELERAMNDNSAQIAKEAERADCIALMESSQKRLGEVKAAREAHGIFELLRRFESLHALEDKVKKLDDDYDCFARANSRNGFLPDREYVNALTGVERDIIAKKGELLGFESEYASLKAKGESDARLSDVYAEVREAGGEDAVMGEYETMRATGKSLGVFCGVFAALSALTLIFGALTLVIFSAFLGLGVALMGAGALFACAFIGMMYSKNNAKKKIEKFLSRFGVSEDESLADIIRKAAENEEESRRLFEVFSVVEGELKTKRAELEALTEKRKELAACWGGEDTDINLLIANADEICKKAEAHLLEKQKYELAKMSAQKELAAYSEDELKKRFVALGVPDADKVNDSAMAREADFLKNKIETLNYKKIEAEKQLIALGAAAKDPTKLSAKAEELEQRIAEMARDHAAYKLAIEAIGEASERLRAGVTPRLSAAAKGYMSSLTGGKYSEGGFASSDGEFAIAFEYDGEHRRLDALSAGTKDAAYISLRLSLADLLYRKGAPILVLDESSCYLDDTRTANMLELLLGCGKQSIIFSCRSRERELLSGKKYNYVRL